MSKPTRAEFLMGNGLLAVFAHSLPAIEVDGPFLVISVADYDEAEATVETLDRSRRRKAATTAPKDQTPTQEEPEKVANG
jgi:hypothetical protein